jgi:predicted  nucleic acid-binding Zn-ribbon protein
VRRHDNELQEQNEKLQESIKQAMESINHANATITGLEDEKAGLISCIEEEEAVIKELKSKFE